jgi:hypothetical protein
LPVAAEAAAAKVLAAGSKMTTMPLTFLPASPELAAEVVVWIP